MQHLCQSMQEEKTCRKSKLKQNNHIVMSYNFDYQRNKEREKAIKLLEKLKSFESSHTMYRYKLPNGIIVSSLKKERLEEMKSALEANK